MLHVDPERTHVVIETTPRGMLARLAHELRIEARNPRGETQGESEVRVSFPVAAMRVIASRKHGGDAPWGEPSERDRPVIEQKIRDEVFAGVTSVLVRASLDGTRAAIEVSSGRGAARRECAVRVEREGDRVRAVGEATLSLAELHTGEPHVPLGAVKLEDSVRVRFDVALRP